MTCTVIRLRDVRSGIHIPIGPGDFSFPPKNSRSSPERTYSFTGRATGVFHQGMKRMKLKVDQSNPSSSEASNEWSCNSSSPIRLNGYTGTSLPVTFPLTY